MAKQNWQEVEFAQALGMATNIDSAGRKFAQMLLNAHTHDSPGKISLRPGYALKYSAPSDPTISNSSFLNFEMFMDKQAVPAGQEITCLIQKGTITALTGSGLSNTQNALCFWIRPYWNGSAWIDAWQWLNRIIITNVTTGALYHNTQNMLEVYGNAAQGLGTGALVGWTAYNVTQNQFAKVITSVADGSNTRICHTLYNSLWNLGDVIMLMQSYYDLNSLAEIYNCAADEIVFHKVNDDLRIGFGGKANSSTGAVRTGIAIGYRNTSLLLNNFNFSTTPSDLTSAALTAFASINKVIMEPFIPDTSIYGLNTTITSGALTLPVYYFDLTVKLDNYEEILVDSSAVYVQSGQGIQLSPYIILGKDSLRATSLCLYVSTDGITYYKIFEYYLRNEGETGGTNNTWQIVNSGELTLSPSLSELYTEADAASIANETDSIGTWQPFTPGVESVTVDTPGASSTYSIKAAVSSGVGAIFPISLGNYGQFLISLYLKASAAIGIYVSILDENMNTLDEGMFNVTTSFAQYQVVLSPSFSGTPSYFAISTFNQSTTFWFDLISIKANELASYTSSVQNGIEMSDSLGYTPGASLVMGWDQALVFHGSTYFLNPYVGGERLDGFIYVSIINSANSFMFDIATADNYRELDTFESYEVIGMILLPTMELLILMNNCITAIDPDTGIARNPVFNVGVISRDSIVNINGIIFWCDDEDIYMLNIGEGLNPKALLENTIRDLYQALANKNLLFCVRDQYNTYRVRVYGAIATPNTNPEFLLSKNGWIQEQKYNYPEIYRVSVNKKLNFLSKGIIYEENTELVTTIPTDDTGEVISDDGGEVVGT